MVTGERGVRLLMKVVMERSRRVPNGKLVEINGELLRSKGY